MGLRVSRKGDFRIVTDLSSNRGLYFRVCVRGVILDGIFLSRFIRDLAISMGFTDFISD